MRVQDVFNASSIAYNWQQNAENQIPFLGEAYFPPKKKMGLDLSFIKGKKGVGISLKQSAFDALPTVRPRGELTLTKHMMPFFRESKDINETNLMELSRIEDVNSPFLREIIDSLYDDTGDLLLSADVAAEKLRMQLLAPAEGKMQIVLPLADNTAYTYNYDTESEWKTGNYATMAGTASWDNKAQCSPLKDLQTAKTVLAAKGVTATTAIMNSATFNYLLEAEQITSAFSVTAGTFIDNTSVADMISRRLGLSIVIYDRVYQDVDGVQKKFYPDDYVTVLGDSILGNTYYGTTPEEITRLGFIPDAAQPPVDITVTDKGVAVAVQSTYSPALKIITTVSQIVLPSYEGQDGVYVMKVKND